MLNPSIDRSISFVFVLLFFFSEKTILKIKIENLRLKSKIIIPCLLLGLAPFMMQASESIIIVCFNTSLQKYGGDIAVGAMTILSSVMQFAMLPLQGLAQGSQPITSYNYGSRNSERVIKTFKLLLIVSLIYSTTLYLIVMIFPKGFASMFSDDAHLINYTSSVIRTYFAVLFIFGIQVACQMTFISIGNAKSSILVAFVRKFALLLPLIYIVPALTNDKTLGVFLAEPISDFIAVSFTAILFSIQFKKSIKLITN